ncbi:ADAMTS-like protein 4 isoform X3 [Mya arenaria]|uniref:ADAMTS-like protein 4 isoform X3 n=1 Tax=Mya arenaria TaxID=6604 RepID=UPI0022E2BABF|nr:ADAMTS-like protein 4 isoform X3 [Mya arenaria]
MTIEGFTVITKIILWSIVVALISLHVSVVLSQDNSHVQRHPSHAGHGPEARWDVWTNWTPCSVNCGTGVTSRTRDCRSMITGEEIQGCAGTQREIKLCEITGCVAAAEDPCSELEARTFGGKRYRWLPYTHPRDICEAACRPVGAGFFLGLGRSLPDGSACGEEKVCVGGLCKAVGCDKVVDSGVDVDSCGVCGGDGTSCSGVDLTFSDDVKFGYHTFATIPRGATNIFVRELSPTSRNYLACKATDGSLHLNTDFRLSRFGEHPGAGAVLTYERQRGPECPDECIRAEGPTDAAIDLMVLAYSDNTGIRYSYNIPETRVPSQSQYPPRPGQNLTPSGQDEDIAPVVYIEGGRIPGTNYGHKEQTTLTKEKKPIFSHDFKFKFPAKKHDAHAHGVDSDNGFDHDRTDADGETTTPTSGDTTETDEHEHRHVIIVEEQAPILITNVTERTDALASKTGVISEADGDSLEVTDEEEEEEEEEDRDVMTEGTEEAVGDMYRSDNNIPSLYSWQITSHSECSRTCGAGKKNPVLECVATDKGVAVERQFCGDQERPDDTPIPCNYGPCPPSWQPTVWSKCSVTCGVGTQVRDFRCMTSDGVDVGSSQCGSSHPGRDERTCEAGSCAAGWYFTEWPERCQATCGYGTLSRGVTCISDTGNERTACPDYERPIQEKTCRDDNCGGFWLTGSWSECNASCGESYQTRDIACAQKQSGRVSVVGESACADEEKPPTYMSCDMPRCGPTWYMSEWGECSVTCGKGFRSRDIRCMDADGRAAGDCDRISRPRERDPCKEKPCPLSDEYRHTAKVTSAPVTSRPPDPGCADIFVQCRQVLKNNLCQYKYYQKICCASCKMAGLEAT